MEGAEGGCGRQLVEHLVRAALGYSSVFSRACRDLRGAILALLGGGEVSRECMVEARDLLLAVEAGLSWYPPPLLDEPFERVYSWALNGLYVASVAEYYGSRRARAFIAARGFWSRRIIERFLADYNAVHGYRIVSTDVRLRIGWVTVAKPLACPRCGGSVKLELREAGGPLEALVKCESCGFKLKLVACPPVASRL